MLDDPALDKLKKLIGPILTVVIFALASFALHRELSEYTLDDIVKGVSRISRDKLWEAVLLTFISYALLSLYDYIGLRIYKHNLSFSKTLFESFCSYALSHNLGFPWITGGAVRFRLLRVWGIPAAVITAVIIVSSAFLWIGYSVLLSACLLFAPLKIQIFNHNPHIFRPMGFVVLLIPLIAFGLSIYTKGKPLKFKSFQFRLPVPRDLAAGTFVAMMDWIVSAAVLYAIFPKHNLSFPLFLQSFLLAQAIGLISHVPGGLGVFETILVSLLGSKSHLPNMLGALVVYRIIYYVMPLVLSLILLALFELQAQTDKLFTFGRKITKPAVALTPLFVTFFVATSGVVLLISGATPPVQSRFDYLANILPLSIIESSHLMSSVVGIALLALSHGLWRRVRTAYFITLGLLSLGMIFSILKGLDVEEAIILSFILLILIPSHDQFYRSAGILDSITEPRWIALLALALTGTTWILLFSYKHVEYAHQLWWELAFDAHASRSLRAVLGASLLTMFIAIVQFISPKVTLPSLPTLPEIETAKKAITLSSSTNASLALLGDKIFLFNEYQTGFVMFAHEGKSLISFGDPIAAREDLPDLIWSFYELCRRQGAHCVFYEVEEENLAPYLDIGLSLIKLGEEAIIPLQAFSLEGKARSTLRHSRNRAVKAGLTFSIASQEEVPDLLPALKGVSDIWLKERNSHEKGFSMGFFNELYLKNFPVALIRKDDRIVAFANILATENKDELSIDLMRYDGSSAKDIMDFLFIELLLWGKQAGYKQFTLGMAPFSGFETRPFMPLWAKLGTLMFTHGERFYNFQGVRNFKEKFDPVWKSRYLAYPGGITLPTVLSNVASLVSGGVRGVFLK